MHTTPIVLLFYFVKHKYPKTNNFYRSAGLVVNFLKYLTEMLNVSYSKCKKQCRTY